MEKNKILNECSANWNIYFYFQLILIINIHFQVFLAASYRNIVAFAEFFNLTIKECWQVLRGDDLPPIESCDGKYHLLKKYIILRTSELL